MCKRGEDPAANGCRGPLPKYLGFSLLPTQQNLGCSLAIHHRYSSHGWSVPAADIAGSSRVARRCDRLCVVWRANPGVLAVAERYNEGKAIDAVLRRIEEREQSSRRADGRSPDDLRDPDPQRRVDYVCTVGDRLYAFEHTGIEPFDRQIEMEVRNRTLFGPIVERFDQKRSDAEFWELCVPVEASLSLKGVEVDRVRRALIGWIEAKAASFPLTRYGDRYANPLLRETITGVPFPVSLHRWSLSNLANGRSLLCGRFVIKPFVTSDLEGARLARLQKAFEDKFPKLAAWKRSNGARTVLVLEENDLSLTNHQRVADSMSLAEARMSNSPDEIFLVSTHIADLWWVTCLRREGRTYYDDGERFYEFDPRALTRLTRR